MPFRRLLRVDERLSESAISCALPCLKMSCSMSIASLVLLTLPDHRLRLLFALARACFCRALPLFPDDFPGIVVLLLASSRTSLSDVHRAVNHSLPSPGIPIAARQYEPIRPHAMLAQHLACREKRANHVFTRRISTWNRYVDEVKIRPQRRPV